jgi:hypothetical protein
VASKRKRSQLNELKSCNTRHMCARKQNHCRSMFVRRRHLLLLGA